MRIVVLRDKQVLRDLTFVEGPVCLGSDARCHVHLPDLRVELEHARFLAGTSGQWVLESASPTAAASVNGRPLAQRCPIFTGDEVAIADFAIKIVAENDTTYGPPGRVSLDELAAIREFPLPRGAEVRRPDEALQLAPEAYLRLARLARELAAGVDIEGLLDRTLTHLLSLAGARLAWVGLRRQPHGPLELMEGRLAGGARAPEPAIMETLEYRCLRRGQGLRLRKLEDGGSALAVPLEGQRGRLGVLYVESKTNVRFRRPDLEALVPAGMHVAAVLEMLLLGNVQQRRASVSTEWTLLREVQARLDPTVVPNWADSQLAVYCRPGLDRGGDVYDFMTMPNGMATMIVGSVATDPLRSAMAVTEVHAAFRVAGLHGDPPRTLLRELNWLMEGGRGGCRLTVAHVVMNPKSGAIEFATAGPIGAVILDSTGGVRDLTTADSPVLGVAKSVELPRSNERIGRGEVLALFTPGWLGMAGGTGELLTTQRMVQGLSDAVGQSPATALSDVQADLAGFLKRGKQPDDITMLLLQRM